ncbi:syntaxin-binding protein 4 isoform X2 [Hydra vulgaris]|uniref:syntaxin-binding protein 4 isoform X2 n=1 Tax=Hydra vulgaris TaxID=6087 RepID=UPI001F5F1B5B|nr:syntaxin-binding protein 4 isoform X2 [Hydra vulgaris]
MADNKICKQLNSTDDTNYDPALNELLELMEDVSETFNDFDVSQTFDDFQYLSSEYISTDQENQERKHVSPSSHSTLSSHYVSTLSLDPMLRVNIDQLELALHQLGISPSDSEKEKLRTRLKTFSNGDVYYGDFVEGVKNLLLKSSSILKLPKKSFNEQETNRNSIEFDNKKSNKAVYNAEMNNIEEKCDNDGSNLTIIDELKNIRKQLKLANNDFNYLKQKNYSTESNKNVYEESSIKTKLKKQEQSITDQPFCEFNKQLAAISSQLKKIEASKRSYEVAVHKLLKFTEMVHMFTESESKKILNGQTKRLQKKLTKLCNDSQDIIKAVKLILDDEPLPFGWEEVYSKDGHRYYINHMTETTSWVHPVSGIQH